MGVPAVTSHSPACGEVEARTIGAFGEGSASAFEHEADRCVSEGLCGFGCASAFEHEADRCDSDGLRGADRGDSRLRDADRGDWVGLRLRLLLPDGVRTPGLRGADPAAGLPLGSDPVGLMLLSPVVLPHAPLAAVNDCNAASLFCGSRAAVLCP